MKNKWVWIAVGLIVLAVIISYLPKSAMCEAPCL